MFGVGAARAVGGAQGPAVLRILEDLVGGLEEPRFDGDDQAFAQLVAVVGATVVRHVRVAVHDVAHAVTAELEVDRVAVFARDVADGVGDVAETVAGLGHVDGGGERFLSALDDAQVFGVRVFADHEADGGIGHPAVHGDGEIEGDEVAVLQAVIVRHTVQHGVVDGGADVVGERAGAEVRSVVNIAGFGALAVHDLLVDELVDFEQIGAHLGGLLQFLQNAADETAGRLHLLDFTRGLQFDHEVLSTLLRLVLNSRPARGQPPAITNGGGHKKAPGRFTTCTGALHRLLEHHFLRLPKVNARITEVIPITTMAHPPKIIMNTAELSGLISTTKPAIIEMMA